MIPRGNKKQNATLLILSLFKIQLKKQPEIITFVMISFQIVPMGKVGPHYLKNTGFTKLHFSHKEIIFAKSIKKPVI